MKTLKELAQRWAVSELQIWSLIRNKQIKSKADRHNVWINAEELKMFWDKNHSLLIKLQDFASSAK